MSSTITIGFLDRTSVCVQAEFTAPLADDERRELLIHASLLTGRAFASLTPDRQRAFAGVLREWVVTGFETCPLQVNEGDPMACPHRFASTFLAPAREYALATIGCGPEAGGIDYFLPMAAAACLRYVAEADDDPEELLKPALALCFAATVHPVTVDNHFEMAAASLPKVGPIVDRTIIQQQKPEPEPARDLALPVKTADSSSRRSDTRRSLIVSACLAAVLIVLGVQYLSTRDPRAGGEPAAVRSPAAPKTPPKQSQEGVGAHGGASISEGGLPSAPITHEPLRSVAGAPLPVPHPVTKPPSPKARAYLRQVRDLAENSLAQVEVMVTVVDQAGTASEESVDTLEYGIRQLRAWRQQFAAIAPPGGLTRQHGEVEMVLKELGGIARLIQSPQSKPPSGAIRDRLLAMHAGLERVLSDADGF